jgi:ankyrin repeat protein
MVRLLIKHKVNVNATDKAGATAMHCASNGDIIEVLLENGAAIDAQTLRGSTPLHLAASAGRSGKVGVLLKMGAMVDIRNEDGDTPLHLAADAGNSDTLEVLLEQGAKVDIEDQYGRTPLCRAASNRQATKMLLDANANVNHRGRDGETALHCAERARCTEVAELLLKRGAAPGITNKDGKTARDLRQANRTKLTARRIRSGTDDTESNDSDDFCPKDPP